MHNHEVKDLYCTWLRMVKARHRRKAFRSISESHVMERTVVGQGIDLPRSGDFFTFLRMKLLLSLTSPVLCSQGGLFYQTTNER